LKLTKSLVLQGINYRTSIYLPAYDATVEVRPLSDVEFSECRNEVDVFGLAKDLGLDASELAGKSPEEIEELQKNLDLEGVDIAGLDVKLSRLYRAVAKRGLIDADLKELVDNPRKGEPGEPDQVMAFELLKGGSLDRIGAKILEITTATVEAVENFSSPLTEPSSASSTPQDTG
jgi:hypothetical protein